MLNCLMSRRLATNEYVPERIIDQVKAWAEFEKKWDEDAVSCGASYKVQVNTAFHRSAYYFDDLKSSQIAMVVLFLDYTNGKTPTEEEAYQIYADYIEQNSSITRKGDEYVSALRCGIDDVFEVCVIPLIPESEKPKPVFVEGREIDD